MTIPDPLDAVDAAGQAARAARKLAQRSPERKAKRNRGRIQRNRGTAAERWVAKYLANCWFRRVPGSGALGGALTGDVARLDDRLVPLPPRVVSALEVKRRAGCDKGMRTQLAQGDVDGLVRVPGNGDEPLVVLRLETFRALLLEAGYDSERLPRTADAA